MSFESDHSYFDTGLIQIDYFHLPLFGHLEGDYVSTDNTFGVGQYVSIKNLVQGRLDGLGIKSVNRLLL